MYLSSIALGKEPACLEEKLEKYARLYNPKKPDCARSPNTAISLHSRIARPIRMLGAEKELARPL